MTRFQKAYDALVKAYFEGTLITGSCHACAVGNIVAAAQGGKITMKEYPTCTTESNFWNKYFYTDKNTGRQMFGQNRRNDELLPLTGYSIEEMAKVEYTFETKTKYHWTEYSGLSEQQILEDQYNGLEAVVTLLMSFDNMDTDPSYTNKFREHPKLATV